MPLYLIEIAAYVIIAYLIGNISPAIIIGNFYGIDIRKEGSGNAGTTNVLRVLGPQAAVVTLLVDVIKGCIAVTLSMSSGVFICTAICAVAVVVGHIFPVFYKFKGGKGVATSFGVALIINWPSAVAALLIAACIVGLSKKMSMGSIAVAVGYPLLVLFYFPKFFPYSVIIGVLIIFAHRSNIRKIIKGEEGNVTFGHIGESNLPAAPIIPTDFYEGNTPAVNEKDKKNITVLGSGSFGTALANMLAQNGQNVSLWGRNAKKIELMKKDRINSEYLPRVILSDNINYSSDLKNALEGSDIVLYAVPTQKFREMIASSIGYIKESTVIVNIAKGIEKNSEKRLSIIAAEYAEKNPYVALSGPSHAEEIGMNLPTTLVAASRDRYAAMDVQNAFMNEKLRVYTNDDVAGVELGGALKNVIAIGTGISDGMGFGDNAKAAMMTRGIHEISRLGLRMGADITTFNGLTGIGDLIVTCTSDYSRNRRCGILIGKGYKPEEAVEEIGMVVEGFYTVEAAYALAKENDLDMPITEAVYKILKGDVIPEEALKQLMSRDKKNEFTF